MDSHDELVAALVRALDRDSSPEALRRAIAAVRIALRVSPSRAYAILVRASSGVSTQRETLLAG